MPYHNPDSTLRTTIGVDNVGVQQQHIPPIFYAIPSIP